MSKEISKSLTSPYTTLVNQQRANHFDWGSIQWLVSGDLMNNAQITFGYVEIAPGQKNPKHYHPNSDEVLYLLEGELNHSLGDEVVARLFAIYAGRVPPEADLVVYWVEKGRILYPVKGATIVGNGPDALTRVSMIGNDMKLDTGVGTCGKEGQSVPVGVGQPTLRIDGLTVGGTA